MADEQQFDLQQLLSNPWTQVGMSLLGASQQRNPYQAALQNMMQLQQQQQAMQQQQQQRQQQMEAFALQQKARQQALDQEARRQQFLQGQQQQMLGAGPPTPADQQRLMLLGGLEAGLSPTELATIEQPTDEELAAKRIKLAGGQGYFEYNPQTKQMEYKSIASTEDGNKAALAERGMAVKERLASAAEQRAQAAIQGQAAKAAKDTTPKLRESEAKATTYYSQMQAANNAYSGLVKEGFDPTNSRQQFNVALAGGLANPMASSMGQRAQQAQEQWSEAYLRFKTGAASTKDEVKRNTATFFPIFGDQPAVIAQKAAARTQAERDIALSAGQGVELLQNRPDSTGNAAQQSKLSPQESLWLERARQHPSNKNATPEELIEFGRSIGRIK